MDIIKLIEGRGVALNDAWIDDCLHLDVPPRAGTLYLLRESNGIILPGICYEGEEYVRVAIGFEVLIVDTNANTMQWERVDLTSVKTGIENAGSIQLELIDRPEKLRFEIIDH